MNNFALRRKIDLILGLIIYFSVSIHAQVLDSTITISGRVFNASTGTYEANKAVYLSDDKLTGVFDAAIEDYSVTNDSGYFEFTIRNVFNFNFFNSRKKFTVEQCNGVIVNYPFEIPHFATDYFPGNTIVICDNPLALPNNTLSIVPRPGEGPHTFNVLLAGAPDSNYAVYYAIYLNNELVYNYEYTGVLDPHFEVPFSGIYTIDVTAYYEDDNFNEYSFFETESIIHIDSLNPSEFKCSSFINHVIPENDNNYGVFLQGGAVFYKPQMETWWSSDGETLSYQEYGKYYFDTPGVKEICLNTKIEGECENVKCKTVEILDHNQLCSAEFTVFSDIFEPYLSIYYDFPTNLFLTEPDSADEINISVNGEPYYIPDGATHIDLFVRQPGDKTICLEHVQEMCTNTSCENIVIPIEPNAPCIANFQFTHIEGETGKVAFVPTSYADAYTWSFGDGNSSTANFPQHQFNSVNTYQVCLTAIVNGCTSPPNCKEVPSQPIVNCIDTFYTYQHAENRALFMSFGENSQGSNGPQYSWTFGDGSAPENQSYVMHSFANSGTYNVCLTISNVENCPATPICSEINIGEYHGALYGQIDSIPPGTNLSDSKVFLYEVFPAEVYPYSSSLAGQQYYFVLRDSSSISPNNRYRFSEVPFGMYTAKFEPGSLVTDTSIIPCYLTKEVWWQNAKVMNYGMADSAGIFGLNVQSIYHNTGIGSVNGVVLYGTFRLDESVDFNGGNLFLIDVKTNRVVRHVALNGAETFSLNQLDYGYYTLILDLPGYLTEPVPVIILPDAPFVNVTLNYLELPDAPFTVIPNESKVSDTPFLVFPNPNQGNTLFVNSDFKDDEVSIFTIRGERMETFSSDAAHRKIHLSHFNPGLYFIQIGNKTSRFMVSE